MEACENIIKLGEEKDSDLFETKEFGGEMRNMINLVLNSGLRGGPGFQGHLPRVVEALTFCDGFPH